MSELKTLSINIVMLLMNLLLPMVLHSELKKARVEYEAIQDRPKAERQASLLAH